MEHHGDQVEGEDSSTALRHIHPVDPTNIIRDYWRDFVFTLILGAPVMAAILVWRWHRYRHSASSSPAVLALLDVGILGYALATASVTLTPKAYIDPMSPRISWDVLASDLSYGPERVQVIGNLVLLAPLAFLIMLRLAPRLRWTLKAGAVALSLPLAIELLQAFVIAGRVAAVEDVVLGGLGAFLGGVLAKPVGAWTGQGQDG